MRTPRVPEERRSNLLAGLVLVVFPAAAIDTLLVHLRLEHWAVEAGLFGGMLLLWGALALLALPFAALIRRWRKRRKLAAWSTPLLFCLALPVVGHTVLDQYTVVGAGLSSLHGVGPWLATAGAALGVLVLAILIGVLGRRVRLESKRGALIVALVSSAAALLLPFRSSYHGPTVDTDSARPNLLLVITDTVRARSLKALGGERETSPNLSRLAESAALFADVRSASNFTFTSHLSMLTGVYPSEHGAWLLNMRYDPVRAPHVAAALNLAGYRTAAFVGTNVLAGQSGIEWGFETYDDHVDPGLTYGMAWSLIHDMQALAASVVPALEFDGRPHWIQDFQRPADGSLAAAQAWIEQPDSRPYFCMLNLYDAHWPYLPDAASAAELVRPYDGLVDGFAERKSSLPKGYKMTPEDDAHMTDLYEAEIMELDRKLGAFFDAVGLDNTAVVIVADHGEAFGEGGRYEHNDLIEPQVHVPLLVRPAGGLDEARISAVPGSGIDVAPILLGLAGVEKPATMRGLDLMHVTPPLDRARLVEDRDHLSADQNHFAIYRGGFKFVRTGAKAEGAGLFELASDPDAIVDVSAQFPELAAELDAELDRLRASWGGASETLEETGHTAAGLGDLGYLGD